MYAGLLGAAMHSNNLSLQPIEERDFHLNSLVRIHAGCSSTKLKLLFGHNQLIILILVQRIHLFLHSLHPALLVLMRLYFLKAFWLPDRKSVV